MLSHRRTIGLAISPQGIAAVEIEQAAAGPAVSHAAALAFSDQANLDHADALGAQLKDVLRAAGFAASRCVIGLAGSYLATREKTLPTSDSESIRGIVSIASERDFASAAGELVFDYSCTTGQQGAAMLLAAAPRKIVDQLLVMAKAAGLSVAAITSSIASLAAASNGEVPPAGRLVLCLAKDGGEWILQTSQGLRLLRHVNAQLDTDPQLARMAADCRRMLAQAPADSQPGQQRELLVWDAANIAPASLQSLAVALGCTLRVGQFPKDLGMTAAGNVSPALASSAALASAEPLALDFLHSKLTPPRRTLLGRKLLWGGAAIAALLGLMIFLALDWRTNQQAVDTLTGELAVLRNPARQAREIVDKATFARTWYDQRPPLLDCMNEITKAFTDDGSIWATSLSINEPAPPPPGAAKPAGEKAVTEPPLQVQITGKSVSDKAVQDLDARLKSNPRLSDVKFLYSRQASATSKEVSFAISLSLRGVQ